MWIFAEIPGWSWQYSLSHIDTKHMIPQFPSQCNGYTRRTVNKLSAFPGPAGAGVQNRRQLLPMTVFRIEQKEGLRPSVSVPLFQNLYQSAKAHILAEAFLSEPHRKRLTSAGIGRSCAGAPGARGPSAASRRHRPSALLAAAVSAYKQGLHVICIGGILGS
mgnify:CR=1 FL=1